MVYRPWGRKESDMTEWPSMHTCTYIYILTDIHMYLLMYIHGHVYICIYLYICVSLRLCFRDKWHNPIQIKFTRKGRYPMDKKYLEAPLRSLRESHNQELRCHEFLHMSQLCPSLSQIFFMLITIYCSAVLKVLTGWIPIPSEFQQRGRVKSLLCMS